MISERTLKKWRRDALKYPEQMTIEEAAKSQHGMEMVERILRLTQELMDAYLIRR